MSDDERDVRDQIEADDEEDSELDENQSADASRGVMKKLPGAKKWGDLTMKKGLTDNRD